MMATAGLARLGGAVLALGILTACAEVGLPPEDLAFDNIVRATNRNFADAYLQQPFSLGQVSVVATENGVLRSYRLVPCQGGATVCAGGPNGRPGRLQVTRDHAIVTGLYGRTFFLSPGGDGTLRRGSRDVPLAWNSDLRIGPQPLYPIAIAGR